MNDSVSQSAGGVTDLRKARRRRVVSEPTDRIPPHALDVEQAIIGSIVVNASQSLPQIEEACGDGAEVFYDLRNQTIFKAALVMHKNDKPIDLITLQQFLSDRGELEQVGGIPYLNTCQDAVTSLANLDYWLEILLEKYLMRKMIHVCTDVVSRVYRFDGTLDEMLDLAEKEVLAVAHKRSENGQVKDAKALVSMTIDTLEMMHNRKGAISGIPTGFAGLDKMTDGLHAGEMIVIAARPSKGKTSLAMNIVEHVAIELKIPTAVFSLEMTADQLMLRTVCSQAKVNLRHLRDGFFTEADFSNLSKINAKIRNAPLFVDDTSGLSVMQLRGRARRLQQLHGIKLFVIDYLQLLCSTNHRAENRQQEIADISSGIKNLAKELRVPVIVLSQLNRDMEREKGRKPRLADLRESGAIEQDADVVGLLYEPEKEDDSGVKESLAINLLIAKQRNGPTGDVNLTFLKNYTRFESASKITEDGAQRNPHAND